MPEPANKVGRGFSDIGGDVIVGASNGMHIFVKCYLFLDYLSELHQTKNTKASNVMEGCFQISIFFFKIQMLFPSWICIGFSCMLMESCREPFCLDDKVGNPNQEYGEFFSTFIFGEF